MPPMTIEAVLERIMQGTEVLDDVLWLKRKIAGLVAERDQWKAEAMEWRKGVARMAGMLGAPEMDEFMQREPMRSRQE